MLLYFAVSLVVTFILRTENAAAVYTSPTNTPYACTVTCSTTSEGCGPANHDTIGGASACPTGDTWAGCDRDVCQDVCNGTAVAKYTNVDVTKNGKTFTCFNASSLIQTVQEDARQASYAYNCGVNETHAAYGRFMPGNAMSDCYNGYIADWNTETINATSYSRSNTPYACTVTCSTTSEGCGPANHDTIGGASACPTGDTWAGCDRDVCQDVCNGTAVARYTNVDVTKNGKTFTCFNASSLIQTVQEDARQASYAYNCGVNETHAAYGRFMPGNAMSDCYNGYIVDWMTETLSIHPPPPSPPPSPSPPPTTGAPQGDHDHDDHDGHDHDGISGATSLSLFVLFVHTLGLSFLM